MAVTQALAIAPGLHVMEAEPEADSAALIRLARWCHRYTPLASAAEPDGLWLDVTGCAHLFGDEAGLLQGMLARFARDGLQARAAAADTPGAAHALSRHGADPITVSSPGAQGAAISQLPVAALRLPPELEATLRRLGFEQVGHLARIPRALLARRFGLLPGLRLDQAHGRVQESLTPLPPEQTLQRRIAFLEPLLTAEALSIAITHLVEPICAEMERQGLGARQIDLMFERIDSHVAAIRIGTARPSRDVPHLVRMLTERLDTIDPGLGVEAMRLVAPLTEPLRWEQQEGAAAPQAVTRLVDRLANRLGADRVYRAAATESEMPERIVRPDSPGATIFVPFPEISKPIAYGPFIPASSCPSLTRIPTRFSPEQRTTLKHRTSNADATTMAGPWMAASSPRLSGLSSPIKSALSILAGPRIKPEDDPATRPAPSRWNALQAPSPEQQNRPPVSWKRQKSTLDRPHMPAKADLVSFSQWQALRTQRSKAGDKVACFPSPEAGQAPRLDKIADPEATLPEPPVFPWKRAWIAPRPLAGHGATAFPWPGRLHAPARLFKPPRPIEALAALPDQPPIAFTWRRHRHRVRRAEGPERIHPEWWREGTSLETPAASVRDYFRVEDETGQRFWLFRLGDGIDPCTGDLSWFLHGIF